MKKIYILLAFLLTGTSIIKAQDTLIFEDFELNKFYAHKDSVDVLPGNTTDTMWYSCDMDMLADGSTTGTRPNGWFAIQPFSVVDQYQTIYGTPGTPDTNTVLSANSWNNLGDVSGAENNWLVTPSIKLGTHDTLFWKSAPFQTPRYLDGYEVLLSTTTNDDFAFTNKLFTGAEMVGTPGTDPDTVYSDFTFAPTTGTPTPYVHGLDGTYIDPAGTTTPVSHKGRLHPFSAPLDTYANQTVFVAFHHNSHDDNLISLDDVMIRGTLPTSGIDEKHNDLALSVFPNPASDNVQVNYTLTADAIVVINVYDVTGKVVATVTDGNQIQGRHFAHINTSGLSAGFYTVSVKTQNAQSVTKLIVR